MQWERAKTYILITFIILNMGLAGLLYLENRRYTLGSERVSNINTVLSANNINLYTAPMRRFAPMRHLNISGFYYDIPALLEIFFNYPEAVYREETEDERHYIFREGYRSLEISNGFITFDNNAVLGENDPWDFFGAADSFGEAREDIQRVSLADAITVTDEFIDEFFPDFVRDIAFDQFGGGGVHIIYLQEYRGRLIQSNFIEFLVTTEGIAWIEMQFGRVLGYGRDRRMIFAPDEILLTFMQRMQHEAMIEPIFISSIDMVYLQEYASDQIGSEYPAAPFYRIFVSDRDFPFLINAYTNMPYNF